MLTRTYLTTMAVYNRWQNRSIFDAADTLTEAARREDRGAFWGSIHATLSHLIWGDYVWMARFDGWATPDASLKDSGGWVPDWDDLKARRIDTDAMLLDWARRVSLEDTGGDMTWTSSSTGRAFTKPRALCIMQVFNHQTHHRGQVHAMLTAAGARPTDTDLPFMPASEEEI